LDDDKLPLTVVIRPELLDQVQQLTVLTGQGRDSIIEGALEAYLNSVRSELHEDADGFAELDQGRYADLDDVLKKASKLVDDAEAIRARRAG
jgi:predicted transcriptional regulator